MSEEIIKRKRGQRGKGKGTYTLTEEALAQRSKAGRNSGKKRATPTPLEWKPTSVTAENYYWAVQHHGSVNCAISAMRENEAAETSI